MANFELQESPNYEEKIRKFETTDPAHADLFNTVFEKIINNISYVKKRVDKIDKEKIIFGSSSTQVPPGSILFVTDNIMEEAAFSNVEFNSQQLAAGENWGKIEENLTVAEQAKSDTVFFAQIKDKERK